MRFALHLCRRNKGRSGWIGEGGYGPIVPALNDLNFDMLMLEFAIPVAGDKRILSSLSHKFDIGLGCVDCRSPHIDTPEEIVVRVEEALNFIAAERIYLHPDCGFAPGSSADIPIDEAYRKIRNLSLAAKILREKYG
jgi:5-methyltetrahydropteroyltriglutamate--homocysteine methyltransferase